MRLRRLLRAGGALGVGVGLFLTVPMVSVWASMIGDPFGLVQIGTAGESTNGSAVSISNGGSAYSSTGLAMSTGSVNCSSSGTVAVSRGCADNGVIAADAQGTATGADAAVSASGPANAGVVAVSGQLTGTKVQVEGQSYVGNTGVAPAIIPPADVSATVGVESMAPPSNKLTNAAQIEPNIVLALAAGAAGAAAQPQPAACADNACPPSRLVLSQPLQPQQNWYTCGPASTRLVVWQITGTDPGESTFYGEEHTNSQEGTYAYYVVKALNSHQSRNPFGWTSEGNLSFTDFMADVEEDVWEYNSSLIEDVYTANLSFWANREYGHYDVIYGYDDTSAGHVYIADEYNAPTWEYRANYNPYGLHYEPAHNAYAAVENGQGLVW